MVQIWDLSLSRWLTIPLGIAWFVLAWQLRVRKAEIAHVLMLVFITWALVGVLVTLDMDRSWRRALAYCQLFLQAWIVFQFTRSRRDWHDILQAFLVGEWIPVLGLFVSWRDGNMMGDGRYTAPGFDPNDLAATLALGIPIAWYQVSRFNRWRWPNGLFIGCAVAAALMTASRGGLVALAIGALFPLWTMWRTSWKRMLGWACVLALMAAVVANLRDEISFHRLATLWPQLASRDLNGRYDTWVRGYEVLMEHPVFGVGPGAFSTATSSGLGGYKVAAHNTFVEIAVEHGVLGLALFGLVIASLFRQVWRLDSLERGLLVTLLSIWIVAGSALSWENREITWLIWAFCASCKPKWFRAQLSCRPARTQ